MYRDANIQIPITQPAFPLWLFDRMTEISAPVLHILLELKPKKLSGLTEKPYLCHSAYRTYRPVMQNI